MWFPGPLLWLTLARAAEPGTPTPPPDDAGPPAAESPEAALRRAVALYQSGLSEGARQELQRILAQGPTLPDAVRQEALAWLGDIQFSEQGMAAARNSFAALLGEDPTFTLDPFEHAPEVCAAFEAVKADLRSRPALTEIPETPARPPFPTTVFVPGGYHYFQEGKPAVGILVGGVQLGGLAISVATGVDLLGKRQIEKDDEEALAAYDREWVATLLVGTAGWAAFIVPIAVETSQWRRAPSVSLQVGAASVGLTTTF